MRKSGIIAVGYLIVMTGDAHAYLDPGTGTIILQGLIAGAATGMYFIRSRLRMVASYLSGRRGSGSVSDTETSKSAE